MFGLRGLTIPGREGKLETNGGLLYYQYDALGNVTDLTDRQGAEVMKYRYDVFGGLFTGITAPYNTLGLTGKTYDLKAGLRDFSDRWYDPVVGRFTQPDAFKGFLSDPVTQHLYAYTGSNPVNRIDPTGNTYYDQPGFVIDDGIIWCPDDPSFYDGGSSGGGGTGGTGSGGSGGTSDSGSGNTGGNTGDSGSDSETTPGTTQPSTGDSGTIADGSTGSPSNDNSTGNTGNTNTQPSTGDSGTTGNGSTGTTPTSGDGSTGNSSGGTPGSGTSPGGGTTSSPPVSEPTPEERKATNNAQKAAHGPAPGTTLSAADQLATVIATAVVLQKDPKHYNAEVVDLQRDLNLLMGSSLKVDGLYGNKTEAAVKAFQSKLGITDPAVLGKVDVVTLGLIEGLSHYRGLLADVTASDEEKQRAKKVLTELGFSNGSTSGTQQGKSNGGANQSKIPWSSPYDKGAQARPGRGWEGFKQDAAQAGQLALEAGIIAAAVAFEPADWAINIYGWTQTGFVVSDLVGLLPGVPTTAVRGATKAFTKLGDEIDGAADVVKQADSVSVNQVSNAIDAAGAGRKGPNPDGKKGGPAHQEKINELVQQFKDMGYIVRREYKVDTPGGLKNARYGDVMVTSQTREKWIIQVGKQTKAGNPVARELRAITDLEGQGWRVEFVPYNKYE